MGRIKYLNLLKIHLPISGIVSLLHRLTGVILFLIIPLSIYLLDLSLKNEQGFNQALTLLQHPLGYLLVIIALFSLIYHLFAGLRFLLIDLEWGLARDRITKTAWLVIILSTTTTLLILLGIWL